MANKLLLADGQYEVITVDTTLVGIAGKQYWYRNGSTGDITVTYGGASTLLGANQVIGLVYDGVIWTHLEGKDGVSDVFPIGGILVSSADVIPTGFVEADGRALSRTLYALLNEKYSAMGYPYGSGDGSTTFNIPNLPADAPFKNIVNVRRVPDQEWVEDIQTDNRLSGLESQNATLTVTGSATIGSEGVLDVNVGTATITVPILTVGLKKTIRKISATAGTITINLPATHTFSDGSSSITLTNQYEEVTIERVSSTVWRLFSSAIGGVLNGAVIERGSNANGEWVKYADGTLICHKSSILATGYLVSIPSYLTVTYPISFVGTTPSTVITPYRLADDNITLSARGGSIKTLTQFNFAISGSAGEVATIYIGYTAIGRWK